MITVKKGIRPEETRLQGQHVLFVEGKDGDSIDPRALNELFDRSIRIEPLGASYSIKSVAEALFRHHPTYYFLIDRDHHGDDFITQCWRNFPNPETHNLLIWRRHEIENYFLEPQYLSKSDFCRVARSGLEQKILQFATTRLFLDAANHAVTSIREELKRNWIEKFKNPTEFPNKEAALQKLTTANEFDKHSKNTARTVSTDEVKRRFRECLAAMTDGQTEIDFGVGNWLHMVQGKKILAQIIHSDCFKVQAADGTSVSGKEKINVVVKNLLQKDPGAQPPDFIELKNLIEKRIAGTL